MLLLSQSVAYQGNALQVSNYSVGIYFALNIDTHLKIQNFTTMLSTDLSIIGQVVTVIAFVASNSKYISKAPTGRVTGLQS